jgi:hypothetical protein
MITICIPTMPHRQVELYRLIDALKLQIKPYEGKIHLLTYETPASKNGGPSIGLKRQQMIQQVSTPYLTFIDDDDMPSPSYCDHLMHTATTKVDAMGFRGLITTNGRNPTEFVHSHRYSWLDSPAYKDGAKVYIRPLNHLNPIRTDIATAIGYHDLPFGEDRDYADRLKASGLVRTEYFVDGEFLYNYIYRSKK